MTHRLCPTTKARHASLSLARTAAHSFAIALNAERKLAQNLYAYRCDDCRGWHLTRQAGWPGVILVLTAPPDDLQRWAFPPEMEQ